MSGFTSWVENIASSKKCRTVSRQGLWYWISFYVAKSFVWSKLQSGLLPLLFVREESRYFTIQRNRSEFLKNVVKPLQDKAETIYVTAHSDTEAQVLKRFPNKKTKRVSNGSSRDHQSFFARIACCFFSQVNQKELMRLIIHFFRKWSCDCNRKHSWSKVASYRRSSRQSSVAYNCRYQYLVAIFTERNRNSVSIVTAKN